jgi:hypothetical protein
MWPRVRAGHARTQNSEEEPDMRATRKRLLALLVTAGVAAAGGPVASADALVFPWAPAGVGGVAIGGNQIGTAGCVGTNRPSFAGNNGSTSAQTCATLSSVGGAQTGQISTLYGPNTVNSPGSQVIVSAGPVNLP